MKCCAPAIAFFAWSSALGAQSMECLRRNTTPPIASARVAIAPTIASSAQAAWAHAYADDLRRLQRTGTYARFDDGGLEGRWAQFDQSLVALLIGVSSRVEVVVDSATVANDETGRMFLTVWCDEPSARVKLGSYWLFTRSPASGVRFMTPLVQYASTGRVLRVGAARAFAGRNVQVDSSKLARSLAVMGELASMLESRVPPAFDLVVVPARDTTLSTLGIFDWQDAIPEYTALPGPLSVVVEGKGGLVGMHELIHVATVNVPMHSILVEGLAILMAGTNTRELPELVCAHKEALRKWRGNNLRSLLVRQSDTTGIPPASTVSAVLGGLLARVLVDGGSSVRTLELSPMMIASNEGARIIAAWDASIPKAIEACPANR